MAQPDRETVYAALLTLLETGLGTTFKTYSRRLVALNSYPPASAPVLFQVQNAEEQPSVKGLPSVRTFTVHLVIGANYGGTTTVIPSTALNNLVTAIEGAIGPSLATGFQQLGIPISSARINGKIEYWDQVPTASNWSAALVPIELVATI